jgi:hypothetical protein
MGAGFAWRSLTPTTISVVQQGMLSPNRRLQLCSTIYMDWGTPVFTKNNERCDRLGPLLVVVPALVVVVGGLGFSALGCVQGYNQVGDFD